MTYEIHPSPQSVATAFIELVRHLFSRARLEARSMPRDAAAAADA